MAFLSQDSDMARTSGLAECAKAVKKTNLGRRLLMLTCVKPRLLRLQKSTNVSTWGVGVGLDLPLHHQRNRGGVGKGYG